MRALNTLQKQWIDHFDHRPHHSAAVITNAGLILGADTILMRMVEDHSGTKHLAVEADETRLMTLLSIAYLCRIPTDIRKNIENASEQWQRGDKVLAHFHLAFARLPRLASVTDVYRLYLAGSRLDDGVAPRILLKELGLDRTTRTLVKFDPNQPRVPAGSGRESGQWAKDKNSAATSDENSTAAADANGQEVQMAGDVVHVGTLVGTSISRSPGEIPKTTCHYELTFGTFTLSLLGIAQCKGIVRLP